MANDNHQRCESLVRAVLQSSDIARTLMRAIGGIKNGNALIECVPCDSESPYSAQYVDSLEQPKIHLCENLLLTNMQMTDALSHELIHHYDYKRGLLSEKVSYESCLMAARSEIRAATLSGDCKFTRELLRGKIFSISRHLQTCAKRRALLSLKQSVKCAGIGDLSLLVEKMFAEAFNDTSPFEDIP